MDRFLPLLFFLCLGTSVSRTVAEEPEVCITDGCLVGLTETSRLGRSYQSFLGIPYAKPPIEKLRFQPPEKPEPWKTPRDAKRDGKICPQSIIYKRPGDPESSEDCLYLNVYTPQIQGEVKTDKPFPVIVIFHSGGFQYWAGTRDYFPGNYLLDRDVVVVSINYRLNIFGFLSTEDLVAPGNWGLKDQRFALQWIQDNIAVFGGDPQSVTIHGHDAGAASAHFHALNPSSKGLFHRIIAQSGTALAPWALSLPGEAHEHANYLARHQDCPTDNSSVLVECLRWKPVDDLLAADPIFFVWHIDPLVPWKPVVEPEHEGAFLTQKPLDLLEAGNFLDVPILTGATSHEGLFRAAGILTNDGALINWNVLAIKSYPSALNLYHLDVEELKDIITKIRRLYFNSDNVLLTHKAELINLFSDRYFFHPLAKTVQLHRGHQESPIFAYRFDAKTSDSTYANFFSFMPEDQDKKYEGLCHGDDLSYLFPLDRTFLNWTQHEDEGNAMIERTLDLWINFAIHGNPTPEGYDVVWKPVQSDGVEFLVIKGSNDLRMATDFFTKRLAFWQDLDLDREIPPDADYLVHEEL